MRRASEEPEVTEERGAERRAAEYQDELLGSVAAALGRTVRDGANAAAAAAQLAAETGRARAKAAPAIAGAVESEVRGAVRKAVSRAEAPGNPVRGIDGRDDAKRAAQRASSMVDAAAENANRSYWEALQRVRNPANRAEGYEETLRREVARLAREGVTAYSYRSRKKDGTYSIVKVPVDVGLRREIETAGIRAANEASLRAAANGGALVEVSCTANPRKSHRAWEGRVYRVADPDPSSPLYGTVMRYPRFDDVVGNHMQDYNCHHQVRPWREGQPRWRNPLEGTGYTPEEGSRIMARQAALENEVRKAKREVEALRAAGLDDREAVRRLTAARGRVRALVAEHPKLLERRLWREGTYEGARKKDGTYGRVHLGRAEARRVVSSVSGAGKLQLATPYEYGFVELPSTEPMRRVASVGSASGERLAEGARRADEIRGKEVEHAYVVDRHGGVYHSTGTKLGVNIEGVDLGGAVVVHNHVMENGEVGTFSEKDFLKMKEAGPGSVFILSTERFTDTVDVIREIDIEYSDTYDSIAVSSDGDFDLLTSVLEVLDARGYIRYRREDVPADRGAMGDD